MRSRTAEDVFHNPPETFARSAGITKGAKNKLDHELLKWADVIFVMEPPLKDHINKNYNDLMDKLTIHSLDIPDHYYYMEPDLIDILKVRTNYLLNKENDQDLA